MGGDPAASLGDREQNYLPQGWGERLGTHPGTAPCCGRALPEVPGVQPVPELRHRGDSAEHLPGPRRHSPPGHLVCVFVRSTLPAGYVRGEECRATLCHEIRLTFLGRALTVFAGKRRGGPAGVGDSPPFARIPLFQPSLQPGRVGRMGPVCWNKLSLCSSQGARKETQ